MNIVSIADIYFSGAYPMSQLQVKDSRIPLNVSLFAFSEFHIGNSHASATPAIVFSFNIFNPTSETTDVAFMFNLPFGFEPDTNRQVAIMPD
jgi:uncharacterized protein (DUF608 family)